MSGYISNILTEEDLEDTRGIKANLSDYDKYYNDGTESTTDFSQQLDQLEQWLEEGVVNPSDWFHDLGIKAEDSQAFANAASDRIGNLLSNHYTEAYNGNADWTKYRFNGNTPDNSYDGWYNYHINETSKYVDPVFNELAINNVINKTGLFPNSNDNVAGQDVLFGARSSVGKYEIWSGLDGQAGALADQYGQESLA